MYLCKVKSILLLFFFQLGVVLFLHAQHYVFIEAEGQQPFYIKRGNETYSSTASGFIILSKLAVKELDFVIGFPNKLYPEVSFKVNGLDKDRGFLLKQVVGKSWVLVDRAGAGMIEGGAVTQQILATTTASSSAGFADLLADATGDKTLLEKNIATASPVVKQQVPNNKPKSNASTKTPIAPPKPKSWGIVRSIVQSDDSAFLRITYFEKNTKENWDTILIEIEKPVRSNASIASQVDDPTSSSVETSVAPPQKITDQKMHAVENYISTDCINPIALPKDLRELQRKMAKSAIVEEQIALVLKAMNERCFTTKQIKELGNSFWEEQSRLLFFTKARKWVSDPALYGELEQGFMQESSKKAFREMLKQQPQ